uniref:Uncharacterized protein n=1 Tax=viral metagenome TaxID=1070528 RepID=A0A6H1ZI19_9ZZZZ
MATIFSNTLADLIEMTARLYGDWKSGTVDSGSTTTIVDDTRQEADDYFQNTTPVSVVHIVSTTDGAAPQGESSRATDFTHATGTITISTDKPFTVAPGADDTYAILSELDWDEVKWAINTAIQSVASDALEWVVDETTVVAQDSTWEYALPTNFVWLFRVSQADSNGDFPYPVPSDHYRVLRGTTPKIHFYSFPVGEQHYGIYYADLWAPSSLSDGKAFRLEGLATPSKLGSNSNTTGVSPTYIMFQAAALLHRKRIGDSRYDLDYHLKQAETCEQLANIERARIEMPSLPPNAKKCKD